MKNPNKKIERTKSDNLYGSHPITVLLNENSIKPIQVSKSFIFIEKNKNLSKWSFIS